MSFCWNRLAVALAAGWALTLALGCREADGKDAPRDAKAAADHKPVQTDPAAEDYVLPPLPRARVILNDAYGGRHLVKVEVAATDPARERGLMWRTELAPGTGMLFVFSGSEEHNFWMRNTLIPLDMLFLAGDGTVVGIVRNATPKSLTGRSVGKPSKYVLEVPGGWTEKLGIEPGTKAEIQGISMLSAE